MNILNYDKEGIRFGFRPERIVMSTGQTAGHFTATGKVVTREMLGSETIYQVRTKYGALMVKSITGEFLVDNDVYIGVDRRDLYLFDRDEQRIRDNHTRFPEYIEHLREL